jgi:hypothetical protein
MISRAAQTSGKVMFGLNVAVGGGSAVYHWNEDKKLRAVTDVASMTGVPFTIIPDALNFDLAIFKAYSTMMWISQGAMGGVKNMWAPYAQGNWQQF